VRYQSPSRPWIYLNDDGSTSIVGPVVKKKN
jgi:nuclear factor related to kappa-B-binding protein